jgi:hypothetical protein
MWNELNLLQIAPVLGFCEYQHEPSYSIAGEYFAAWS